MLVILILAQAVSPTPLPSATPDGGPPPPSIVERIDAPIPVPTTVPVSAPPRAVPVPTAPPRAVPAPTAPPKASGTHGNAFGVHVSSFRRRTVAEAEARRLGAKLSLPARVLQVDLGEKGMWYRVVVGEVGSAAEASALRERLKEKGISGGVVQRF